MSEASIIKLGKSNRKSVKRIVKKKPIIRKSTKTRGIDYHHYSGNLMLSCHHNNEEGMGCSGNPYEGGSIFFKCKTCGRIRESSEDGVVYHPRSYKPYLRTIADDMREAGINPDTASDDDVMRFLGSNR